ncbi:MAG TPA: HupE/UreJ family protein [Steroidobacteraceae bacterium]|jgi:hydrogenase/urease accessory protein HupE|nr:HupE/UreJ family protein [Steroidobacteraceae bacterium]
MIRILRVVLVAALVLLSNSALAHEMTMAEMELRETAPGQFMWQWTAVGNVPPSQELTPVWPEGCSSDVAAVEGASPVDAGSVRCGPQGLSGTLTMKGVGQTYSAVMVKVFWSDGQGRVYTFTTAQKTAQLYGSAEDKRGMGEIARAYTVLGVEHILSGFDHLMFVIALLFLVGFNRKLLFTITAFTLAHSLTLALSALGLLTLRSPPVEATIALSIVLVAAEALHRQQTLSRRWPAVVAFLFGLVHGLGFAGALQEIGLPQKHLAVALLTFNVGVEIGQLLVVGLAFALYRALSRVPQFVMARTPALYAIGTIAAYWSFTRIVAIVG